jgi:prepilin-type N-terminal cleavage/methylation domain-containing protein
MHKRGFTLIELLIVVTAVMIVIGFVLPHYQRCAQTKTVPQSLSAPLVPQQPKTLEQACFATTVENVTHEGCDYILLTSHNGTVVLTHKGNCRACIARTANLPAEKQGE